MTAWVFSSGVLILVVIAVRTLLRGKLSPRLQYALWLLVLARLLVPVQFGVSPLSVENVLPRESALSQSAPAVTEPESPSNHVPAVSPAEPSPSDVAVNVTVSVAPSTVTVKKAMDWAWFAKTVWLLGIPLVGGSFVLSDLRFSARLRRSRRRVEVESRIPVYVTAAVDTPCLFGLFRPAVYLTPEVLADPEILRCALAHEQTHFRHGDHIWAALRGACLALHWYDPLVWWAAELSRRDGELACDEDAVRTLGEEQRGLYGCALIRMTCEKRPAPLVTATMMTDSGKALKERVALLAQKPKTAGRTAVAVLLIAALAVGCTFTGKTPPDEPFREDGTVPAALESTGYPAYDALLTQVDDLRRSGEVDTDWPAENISPELWAVNDYYQLPGWLTRDLDGDGTPELLLGAWWSEESFMLFNVYTLNGDGEAVCLANGWSRSLYRLSGNVLLHEGSGGAWDGSTTAYRLAQGQLVPLETVFHTGNAEGGIDWYHAVGVSAEDFYEQQSDGSFAQNPAFSPLSEEEAEEVLESYPYDAPAVHRFAIPDSDDWSEAQSALELAVSTNAIFVPDLGQGWESMATAWAEEYAWMLTTLSQGNCYRQDDVSIQAVSCLSEQENAEMRALGKLMPEEYGFYMTLSETSGGETAQMLRCKLILTEGGAFGKVIGDGSW